MFEADPTRIGGRLFTYYFDGAKSAPPGSSGYYQYFDIGAMRIPLLNTMERLLVDDFTKSSPYYGSYGCLVKYLNDRVEPEAQLKVIKYVFSSENNLLLYNGEPPMKKGTANPPGFGPPAGPIPVQYHAGKKVPLSAFSKVCVSNSI